MLLILTITLFFIIYIYFKNAYNYWTKLGVPTLVPTFPFGNAFRVITRFESVNDKVCEIYNVMKSRGARYAGLYFFSRKVFVAIDPELIKCILSKDFQHFNDRGIYYDEDNDPVSAHLFSLSGTKWKNLRAKLTPAFTPGKTKYMFGGILNCAEEMVKIIKEDMEVHQFVDIKDILARFTTDVIGCCAFGIDCNSLKNPEAEFSKMGKRAFMQTPADSAKMIIIRSFPWLAKLLHLGVFPRCVSNFFKNVVEDTIAYRENNKMERQDFLQLLIQLKNKGRLDGDVEGMEALTINEAAAQAFIFFLAGFETTSTTISFALLEMALNPSIQDRARSEFQRVLSKHENKLTYDALSDMHYLERVVLETLRKYPPAPAFLRKCTKTYQVPDSDVVIEEGLSVLIPAMALHRDPEYYPEPELFNPDRFEGANKKIKEHTYLPFGDGPRICIGMRFAMVQTKLALAIILKEFKFILHPKTILPLVMEKKGIVLTPIGGIWMKFAQLNLIE